MLQLLLAVKQRLTCRLRRRLSSHDNPTEAVESRAARVLDFQDYVYFLVGLKLLGDKYHFIFCSSRILSRESAPRPPNRLA